MTSFLPEVLKHSTNANNLQIVSVVHIIMQIMAFHCKLTLVKLKCICCVKLPLLLLQNTIFKESSESQKLRNSEEAQNLGKLSSVKYRESQNPTLSYTAFVFMLYLCFLSVVHLLVNLGSSCTLKTLDHLSGKKKFHIGLQYLQSSVH